jgi:hypothetical protein
MMAIGSFFIQRPEDALRHLKLLTTGLKKVAWAGLIGGFGCTAMAVFLGRVLVVGSPNANATPGSLEMSGIAFVAWFIAIALIVFSGLYLIAGWGLSHQKRWARYAAGAVFLSKVLLCVWLGRATLASMAIFLLVAGWDLYGLWVLLSKETGQLFSSSEASQVSVKPANLVT